MTDTKKGKVVSLDAFGREQSGFGPSTQTEILRACRTRVAEQLGTFVKNMMDQVDDALFARAEKAESNTQQTYYFDAMREVRLKRAEVEERFQETFVAGFTQRVPKTGGRDNPDGGDTGLVEHDELEEDLAITNMAARIRSNCTTALYALDQRMGLLLNDPELERWENPIGPSAICEAFRAASEIIETGIEVRLVILKLFDQHVVGAIQDVYREVNQFLASRGVLPEIRAKARGNPSPAGQQPTPGTDPGQTVAAADGVPREGGGPAGGVPAGTITQGGVMMQGVSSLTLLQRGQSPLWAETTGHSLPVSTADIAGGTINVLPALKASGMTEDLGKAGNITIDIVAMLFDYILDDRNLHDTMRAQIGRLQIPVLKVALLDQDFFARKRHPARRLLNSLAQVAVSWSDEHGEHDPAYRKIKDTVSMILERFEDDVSLFEDLADELEDFVSREEEQASLRSERSAKIAQGREKLEDARTTTLAQIQQADSATTRLVQAFITDHWKNLLFVACARYGKDSPEWKQATQTMKDLIWSVRPKTTVDERKRLATMQRGLLDRLRRGMETLSIPAEQQNAFLTELVRTHGRTATTEATLESTTNAPDPVTEPPGFTGAAVEALASEQKLPLSALNQPVKPKAAPAAPADESSLHRARNLREGDWVELVGDDGHARRAKLSWISPTTNTYLFTDRQGLKTANLELEELASGLQLRRIRTLDSTPLLDRAVPSVLQEWQQGQPAE